MVALIIYIVGLLVIPIVFGIWQYDVVRQFDTSDYIIACFLLVIWPIVAFFGIGLTCSFSLLYAISYVFRWLFKAGVKIKEHRMAVAYRKAHPEEFDDTDTCEECDGSMK